jgi:molybdopterin molybdotransferase
MIPISDAQSIVEQHRLAPRVTERPLDDARNLWLAEDVVAPEPMPSFDNSAMDGYAVRLPERDDPIADPLPVLGEAQAGDPFEGTVGPGQAVKISTGAVVPDGAERVIRIEDTDEGDEQVQLHDTGKPQGNIRFEGEEVAVGDDIADTGEKITPPLLGRLASLGVHRVPVYEPPTVAVLSTGSELVDADADLQPGQIRNSNRYVLTSLLKEFGATIGPVASVPDQWDDTVEAIDRAAETADLVLVTGGVSVGPHDHVKGAAEAVGFERQFWKVKQKPGKPLFFATRDDTLLFGLPGNPFSAAINAVVYAGPIIRQCLGHPQPDGRQIAGRMAEPYERRKAKRAKYLLVRIEEVEEGEAILSVPAKQNSHMLAGLHQSDGFVRAPVGQKHFTPSEELSVTLFPWCEERALPAAT